MSSYIVHSGWWCDESRKHIGTKYNSSDDRLRTPQFFNVWYENILAVSRPEKIIVVDSASPVRPELVGKTVEFVSLPRNFGHGMVCQGRYGGWTRAFALGAYYAFLADADYSVFVEQDCLLVGDGIIERAIENLGQRGISYGATSPVRIEQSFVVIRRDFIPRFLGRFLGMPDSDRDLFTEVKFQRIQKRDRALSYAGLARNEFVPLPFGYGRNRPIGFDDVHFYAQQWTTDELHNLHRRTGLPFLSALLGEPNV
ncbi:hypothetical protein KKH27_06155 [bacterium]|nr:hypothetical protein [bacterium]MBU1984981.1 hypothetical protein [bacterium]